MEADYFDALNLLPSLVATASSREWDEGFLRGALSAIAIAKGKIAIADAVLELTPEAAGSLWSGLKVDKLAAVRSLKGTNIIA